MIRLLAFDFGASGGRAMLGRFDGRKLDLAEVHRFANEPVRVNGALHWDILRLYHELKQGLRKCAATGVGKLAGLGVDTWGVDFGLLDRQGNLLGNPYHYRDARTEGMLAKAAARVGLEEIFSTTGIAFLKFNTIFQLLAMREATSPLLDAAATMLFTPDLLNYFLTGEKAAEYTIASTSQMLGAPDREWARELLSRLGLPLSILPRIIQPGTVLGSLQEEVCAEVGQSPFPIIAVAEHDTASAVVAVPAEGRQHAYLSSGTWSLMGVEVPAPVISPAAYERNFTNEGGVDGAYRLLKNIMGLWILQECKRAWDQGGEPLDFEALVRLADGARPFAALIDPDDDLFYEPGDMPERVREYCRRTAQAPPDSKGAVVRCILESLALKYRLVLTDLEALTGHRLDVVHIIGGGSQNELLNRFTAEATSRPVLAGPVEATAIGNILIQLRTIGELGDLGEARALVRESFTVREYLPGEPDPWDQAYSRFLDLVRRDGETQGGK